MKIAWVNDHAGFTGGAETYIYQSVHELSQRYDIENILLYSTKSRIDHNYAQVFSFTTVIANIKQQLKLLKPDLIYVHQVESIEVIRALAETKIPVIGFVHDHKHFCLREHKYTTITHETCTKPVGIGCYGCLGFINKKSSFPYISLKTLSGIREVQTLLKKFDHMVVASDYMKNHLGLHGFKEKKITKIPLFSQSEGSTIAKNAIAHEKRFLFVGQLVRGKGVDTLLNAFATLKNRNIVLDICGDGKQRKELEEQSQKLGISSRVVFHGKIDSEALGNYYANAYAVVIPSRAPETFNLVGIEAMKHGKAVLASNVGGISEWLKNEENGLSFSSNDEKELSRVLQKAIDNPQMVKKMGETGLDHYNRKFIAEIHCKKIYELFETLLTKESYAA
ncbi:glycosyltransferase family 4 protein [Sulfurovum sp. ST-21]|uniref:Glycosyltransferase family 4 protein n=1 Tax=Sulfurovum indicum TaxID=2779528 RepID=A0A7M1S3E2_9BACT|nr:glycosyltransferase family 4 protein [Sulfurovum indicum]QOR61945.1 glycosyltransferase family 4 protein [Sulfurovum indicum]